LQCNQFIACIVPDGKDATLVPEAGMLDREMSLKIDSASENFRMQNYHSAGVNLYGSASDYRFNIEVEQIVVYNTLLHEQKREFHLNLAQFLKNRRSAMLSYDLLDEVVRTSFVVHDLNTLSTMDKLVLGIAEEFYSWYAAGSFQKAFEAALLGSQLCLKGSRSLEKYRFLCEAAHLVRYGLETEFTNSLKADKFNSILNSLHMKYLSAQSASISTGRVQLVSPWLQLFLL
jgi:hypothetical protein